MKQLSIIILGVFILSCTTQAQQKTKESKNKTQQMTTKNIEYATFGGGCFWCTEAIFEQLKGVLKVASGYSGGTVKNPTYKDVCTGETGHAEVIHITFNPTIITFDELLDVFFYTHNPTTLNQQGDDKGTQYRSVVFYHNESQKEDANNMIKALRDSNVFADKIVTEVTEFDIFYPAENYHQDYYNNNKTQGYCQLVINPKLQKFQKKYKEKLKVK